MNNMNTTTKQLLQATTTACMVVIIIALQACNPKQDNDQTAENSNLR